MKLQHRALHLNSVHAAWGLGAKLPLSLPFSPFKESTPWSCCKKTRTHPIFHDGFVHLRPHFSGALLCGEVWGTVDGSRKSDRSCVLEPHIHRSYECKLHFPCEELWLLEPDRLRSGARQILCRVVVKERRGQLTTASSVSQKDIHPGT